MIQNKILLKLNRNISKNFVKAKNIKLFKYRKVITSVGIILVCLLPTINVGETEIVNSSISENYEQLKVELEFRKILKNCCENVYGINYDKVIQIAKNLTQNFTSQEYLDSNNPCYLVNKKIFDDKEEGIIMFVRHLYQKPEDFGYTKNELINKNFSSQKGNEEYKVKYYSDIFNIDPILVLAIQYQESSENNLHYNSKAYLECNNPAGLMNPSDTNLIWEFPSPDAGIIEHIYQLKKNYITKGLITPEQIKEKYAPDGADNDMYNLNKYWINGVETFMKEIQNNPSIFDDKNIVRSNKKF